MRWIVLVGFTTAATACGRFGYDSIAEPVYASCTDVRATQAQAPDGFYLIDIVDGAPPVRAFCDMSQDGGGWMLVTRDMIVDERSRAVTIEDTDDANGGLVVRAWANAQGCTGPDDNVSLVTFTERPAWKQIRAHFTFAGGTSCWWIFGRVNPDVVGQVDGQVIVPNLIPFDLATDVIRDQVRMGGAAGDAFDGVSYRCDNDATNFWHANRGPAQRSATAILNRNNQPGPAGLATTTSCTDFAPGTSSPTWWEYRDISVR